MKTRLPATVVALGLASFFTDVGSEMIFPLLPLFLTGTLGAGPGFLGLIEGAADSLSSLLKVLSGRLSDRMARRKPLVVGGYLLAAAARPMVAAAAAPWHVLTVRLADRVGKGVRSAPRDAMIAESVTGAVAGRAFGFHRAMDHAGAVVGPLLATALLAAGMGIRSVFWLAAIPGALAVVCVLATSERPDRREGSGEAAAEVHEPHATTLIRSIARLPRSLRSYLAILLVFSMGNSTDAFLLLRAGETGVPDRAIPLFWMLLHIVKALATLWGGHLSDRIARARLIACGWVVFAVVYLGLGMARGPGIVWLLLPLYGLYYGLTEPAEKALVRELSTRADRGLAYGCYNFIVGAAALPAGLLAGWLWGRWGAGVALGLGAGLSALAACLILLWGRANPGQSPAGVG